VFEDAHTIRVHASEPTQKEPGSYNSSEDALIRGGRILIATGSAPVRPETFPFATPGVYDSDTILELDRLPKTLAVIGAGVVGSEYACTFNALGTTVHVIDGHDVLLPFLDREVSRALMEAMERNGIFFHWNERADACRAAEPNGVSLTLCSGATLALDAVLVATGRKSNTEKLNLSAAGVKVGERGVIPVDERYQTEVPHIYAAGDVIGFPALASTSMQQSHLAVRHAFGAQLPRHAFRLLPTGIYTIPEIGVVGETEESLQRNGVDYVVGRKPYGENARGRIIGDSEGFLKLLFQRSDMKLLGVHALGEQASELVHIGLIAMLTDSTAEIFDEACFNIPTLGALYKSATADAILRMSH